MIETAYGTKIAFTAPHRLATKAGFDILEAGGTAVEAMVAAAAQIAVVYPHMNSIGGDGFWLIKKKNQTRKILGNLFFLSFKLSCYSKDRIVNIGISLIN